MKVRVNAEENMKDCKICKAGPDQNRQNLLELLSEDKCKSDGNANSLALATKLDWQLHHYE